MLSDKWDLRFMGVAELVSSWSQDPGTKVGCVLVDERRIIATGYNGLPQGIADLSDRLVDREWKLNVTVHAEVNAIINAGKYGAGTKGTTLYTTFPCCSNCSSAIIQAGVARVVTRPYSSAPSRWADNFLLGKSLLNEAGIQLTEL